MAFTSTPGQTFVGFVDGEFQTATDDSPRRQMLTLKITSDDPLPKTLSDAVTEDLLAVAASLVREMDVDVMVVAPDGVAAIVLHIPPQSLTS